MKANITKIISDIQKANYFSGSILVTENENVLVETSFGHANRSEKLKNDTSTRFGIASGSKLLTAIAICQLVENGKLSFDTKLSDCLKVDFPHFDKNITVHDLLTHTSGISDYFDEELMDDFEELWSEFPMYQLRRLSGFLPLFQNKKMKLKVGERFHYNNAGYIILGLIIEEASGFTFTDYIQTFIFNKNNMKDSGYFEFDALPQNTAIGYIDLPSGKWKTNIYSLPVKGGSDGGAFITVNDMTKLWNALMNYSILNEKHTKLLLNPHVNVEEEVHYYGYGVWIKKNQTSVEKYHVMGYDPGVCFHSSYYPEASISIVVCSNKSDGAYDIVKVLEKELISNHLDS
ncbi:serine hydrolase [Alkalihalophilus pseudofirmus]|uniref:serine hydrolase domain-containing protein n=1 Tax=Alkalihalophilus pseudofirmus TaxID=79885 RepID=UPI00259B648A|nr:serine hydrolase [Alkalihalophilus pseudofirmus]WEG15117.1 serine hydrolase [Alkalihalophilus pseudofirmus]